MRFSVPRSLAVIALVLSGLVARPARAAGAEALARAVNEYEGGDYARAALGFYDVAEGSGQAELADRAQYYLALTLYKMGLPHSAVTFDRMIIQQGPTHPYYTEAVTNTLDVMDAVGDKSIIPSMLDREYNDSFAKLPKAVIDRINFLVSLWSYNQMRWGDAEAFLKAVPRTSAYYPRARYIHALNLARQALVPGAPDPIALDKRSVRVFRSILDLSDHDGVHYADLKDIQELAQLGLARVIYAEGGYLFGHDQDPGDLFGQAFDEFNKIPRFAKHWRDALFEGAYAAFMNHEPGKALGLLETLHAPVAKEQFVPESWLLQSLIYYSRCLFDETGAALHKMQSTYRPIQKSITQLLGAGLDPDVFYRLVQFGGVQHGVTLPAMLRNELLVDETLRGRRSYILELGLELQKVKAVDAWRGSDLAEVLTEAITQQRALNIQVTGKTVMRDLEIIQSQLKDLNGQAEIIKLEMADREKNLLEAGYDQESVLAQEKLYRPAMPPKGIEYWQFQGEFWPDELGYYRFTVKNACPKGEHTGP